MTLAGPLGSYGPKSSSGGGGWTLISEVTAAGSQRTVSFAAIPQTFRHLVLLVSGLIQSAGTQAEVSVIFNSDGGNHYGAGSFFGSNAIGGFTPGGVFRQGSPDNASVDIALTTDRFQGAGDAMAGGMSLTIPYYHATLPTGISRQAFVSVNSLVTFATNFMATVVYAWSGSGGTGSVADAITQIDLRVPVGNNWLDGSLLSLYGIT